MKSVELDLESVVVSELVLESGMGLGVCVLQARGQHPMIQIIQNCLKGTSRMWP